MVDKQRRAPTEDWWHDEVSLLRSLDGPIPAPALPAGYQVRALAGTGEVADRAAIEREVWHPWPVGKISDDDYARLMRLPGYHRELDVVALTPEGTIAAYVNNWIDPVNRIGVCGPVGTRAALLESLRRLRARGLYESMGFTVVNTYLDYVKTA